MTNKPWEIDGDKQMVNKVHDDDFGANRCCPDCDKESQKVTLASLKDKALLTIEGICLASGRAELDSIYTFAHVANGHCKNPHKDWVKDLDKTYKQLKKQGVI